MVESTFSQNRNQTDNSMLLAVEVLSNITKYLKAEEELWKLKYFTVQKYTLIFKHSSKRN